MQDETERARETAEDLIEVLRAYELELDALAPDLPGVSRLRNAIGAALAEACFWVSDHAAEGEPSPTRH